MQPTSPTGKGKYDTYLNISMIALSLNDVKIFGLKTLCYLWSSCLTIGVTVFLLTLNDNFWSVGQVNLR